MANFKVTRSDIGTTFSCSGEQSLLAAMEHQGTKSIPVGCRGGGCGFCRIQVLDGTVETKKMSVKHVSEEDRSNGYTLACRTFPKTDVLFRLATLVDID